MLKWRSAQREKPMKRQVVIPQGDGPLQHTDTIQSSQDTLEIKRVRECSKRIVVASRNRAVCRFWVEKSIVVLDILQIYGLLWQLSQPWPWPANWLRWTRWINAVNLDVFSFGATGAAMGATSQSFSMWGQMNQYWAYALGWSLVPWAILGGLVAVSRYWQRRLVADLLTRCIRVENVLLQVLQVLYLPVGLAVLRLVNCDANGTVSVDPSGFESCLSSTHIAAVVLITCGLGGSFLVGFPALLRRRIQATVFANDADAHERFLQSKEIECIVGSSDNYFELNLPLHASYKRCGAYIPVETCAIKLALLLIFSVLRSPAPNGSTQGTQGTLFFIVCVGMLTVCCWREPFRSDSTNQLAKILLWLLVANSFFGLLCANRVRSAITVSTAVTSSLTFINVTGLSVLVLAFAAYTKRWLRRHRLEQDLKKRIFAPHQCWPTHPLMSAIIDHDQELTEWIGLLRHARTTTLKSAIAPSNMKPLHELASLQAQLEKAWNKSITMNYPLQFQLHEELLIASSAFIDAFATSPFKDPDMLGKHEMAYSAFAHHLHRLEDKERLVSSRNRRLLRNLRTMGTWAASSMPRRSRDPMAKIEFRASSSKDHAQDLQGAGIESLLQHTVTTAPDDTEIDRILEANSFDERQGWYVIRLAVSDQSPTPERPCLGIR